MKKHRSLIFIAAILVALSALAYYIHYLIFHDAHHLFMFLVGDLAFLPLEVLLVGLVIERIIARREKEERIQKLNMVVGAFFSEIGRPLSTMLLEATESRNVLIENLNIKGQWTATDYDKARRFVEKEMAANFDQVDLKQLQSFLVGKRAFMLRLIENPNLLEHEKFTDLLLACFHLMEELESRPSLSSLPRNDLRHIGGDIKRAFINLAIEWLDYMQHLKLNYPFLFSHYLRISPFQLNPSAIIE